MLLIPSEPKGIDGEQPTVRRYLILSDHPLPRRRRHSAFALAVMVASLLLITGLVLSAAARPTLRSTSCDTVDTGYQCQNDISHFWGQYSPYYTVPSDIPDILPGSCKITFAQVLSRHGSRDPTASKTASYKATVQQIMTNVQPSSYTGKYAFLASYQYTLGADQLTLFGQQEMINSGIKFFNRYPTLTASVIPFFRSSGEARVVESAQNFTQGFHSQKRIDRTYPYHILTISEDAGVNNTLAHSLCTSFESGPDSKIASSAQTKWMNSFAPPIMARLNADLPGAALTLTQTIYIMDLCPFNTVASPTGDISPFCSLFTDDEWKQYDYYETLGKFYGYGSGNPLGPTQGVGFTNELIARLTDTAVHDATSTNTTLDTIGVTFPLGRQLYADFSHDNDMTGIFYAMGLYSDVPQLSNTSIQDTTETGGYSAAWTVPFAARMYVEKMLCSGDSEEKVRILINDRVIRPPLCRSDIYGRCELSTFIKSLSFAQSGGQWAQCFM